MSEIEASTEASNKKMMTLLLGTIGVVYGDIGTSPLYTLKECFAGMHPTALNATSILGILSMICWSLFIVVSVKYVLFILRIDNRGEGGILALTALSLRGRNTKKGVGRILAWFGILGAALFYGDGMITPAISVLSAVEGLEVAVPALAPYIVPFSLIILVGLFAIQSRGTATIGRLFGPIMVIWFTTLALLGLCQIWQTPSILAALNPYYAVQFIALHPKLAFFTLGAVILALTGAEALYTDIGHFGRRPISRAWFYFVLPALLLNYFGQGALLLTTPSAVEHPFYLLAPASLQLPLVILATLAAIIASQAVISGAFSLTSQAVQLGYCPRVNILHTAEEEKRQIYIPQVNWILCVAVMILVLWFASSTHLAAAYGVAVTATMTITTILAFTVVSGQSKKKRYALWGMLGLFLMIDITFFSANLLKLTEGGWFALVMAGGVLFIMLTWKRGKELLSRHLHDNEFPAEEFVEQLKDSSIVRVQGTAVFLTTDSNRVPHALLHNLKHNKVLHERIIFLTIRFLDVPYVEKKDRLVVTEAAPNFYQMAAVYGFKENPSVPAILALSGQQGKLEFELMDTSFFLSRETLVSGVAPAMSNFRRRFFIFLARNAARPTAYFKLPPNRVVEMGIQVEL